MRFDTPVLFQRITDGAYNAENGDYGDDSVESVKVYADVTDAGVEANLGRARRSFGYFTITKSRLTLFRSAASVTASTWNAVSARSMCSSSARFSKYV